MSEIDMRMSEVFDLPREQGCRMSASKGGVWKHHGHPLGAPCPFDAPPREPVSDEVDRLRLERDFARRTLDVSFGGSPPPGMSNVEAIEHVARRAEAAEAERDRLRRLLVRWRAGLVPVGDYTLREDTDAALSPSPVPEEE